MTTGISLTYKRTYNNGAAGCITHKGRATMSKTQRILHLKLIKDEEEKSLASRVSVCCAAAEGLFHCSCTGTICASWATLYTTD